MNVDRDFLVEVLDLLARWQSDYVGWSSGPDNDTILRLHTLLAEHPDG